jgi:hypothetical protein
LFVVLLITAPSYLEVGASGKHGAVQLQPQRQSGIAKIRNSDNHPEIQPRNLILIVALIAS